MQPMSAQARVGVVEDGAVLGLAGVKVVEELVAGGAEGFGGGVEVEAVAGFVLDFGEEDGFALEGGGAGDPVAFREHADDLGVGVLGDLADEGFAVGVGHPVLGLDADFGVYTGLEGSFGGGVLGGHWACGLGTVPTTN